MSDETDPTGDDYIDAAWPSILLDAFTLVHGDRGNRYGPPWEDYQRVTDTFNGLFGDEILTPPSAIVFMCLVKLSRIANGLELGFDAEMLRDSCTDLAGYADCLYATLLNWPPPEDPDDAEELEEEEDDYYDD